jgi:ribosomal protein S18 acetylase RimI-like enzyme
MVPAALERLIQVGNPKAGAQRLVRNAKAHGIDLNLVWGVLGDESQNQPAVRQVCMVVPGAGGTGMCFVSSPIEKRQEYTDPDHFGPLQTQIREIGAALHAAIEGLSKAAGDRVRIAQILFEPSQRWTHEVCQAAGMISVGTLDYLRMDYGLVRNMTTWDDWEEGIQVRSFQDLASDEDLLAAALEASYEGTLDCPELCGMRTMPDVIASHRSTGVFDASRWWVLMHNDQPRGCCLLSHCPANESVELVYLGLCPTVQGRGLGIKLLSHALKSLRIKDTVNEVTCAVDRRNIPAGKVYLSLGFKRFDARCGYVRPI